MKDDPLAVTAKRLWNEAVRDGVFDELNRDRRSKIREAFQCVVQDLLAPEDIAVAFSEILALCLTELEGKFRVSLALHRKTMTLLLRRLPPRDRKEFAQRLRKLQLKDMVL